MLVERIQLLMTIGAKAILISSEDRCKLCYTRPYARCAVAKNQTVPLCTCPTICSRTFQPVCGSDGNTYFNPCEMMKKACLKNFKITAEKKGFCENLCLRKDCTVELPYSSCKVIGNKPRCLCQPFCGGLHRPVCGSDNVTYTNDCMMRKASCETASWVSVKHEGACVDTKAYAQPKQTPCAQKNCSGTPYSFCKMIENKPMCKCPERCNTTLKPICGSDGVTYLNLCLLKVTSCKQGKVVTVKSEGHCQDECSKVNCKFYSKCHIKRKKPICVCPRRRSCSNIRRPVCGSDGNVYPNECIMQSVSCAKRKLIRSIADTRKCSGKLCRPWSPCSFPPYSRCLSFRGQFSCRCPRFCRTTYQPACGSDKRIYGNRCTLQKYACLSRQSIRQVHIRQCAPLNTCYKVVCQRRQRCKMISNKPRCVSRFCVRRCPLKVRLVCGSDNKTYRNECELRRKACMENVRILRARFGACR